MHAWVVVITTVLIACLGLLIPPSVGARIGLSVGQHIAIVGVVELTSAVVISGIVIYYRTPPEEVDSSEWRFDP